MKLVNAGQGCGDNMHSDKTTVYRKRDDFMVLVERSNILYTFDVNDYLEYDNSEAGHMIVKCQVGMQVFTARSSYVRSDQFVILGNLVGYIMVQVTSRIVKP
jgi:hypothetical protein